MEYVNPVLLLIVVSQVCFGLCAWRSSQFLRRMAARFLTRADVVELSRAEGERRMKYWLDELGANPDTANAKTSGDDAGVFHRATS
jgi:phosphoribosylformimino-5-aminoimidazole carboxamide ribonucleotide (ProFAR) isomerase